ncbi:diguanylate cyclase domain-containing protein [Sedimenticola selenatireducens]|uniref:Diguanylate cyclase n=1 Tax=Sedimenticola selenatireducens TaxID=191960 RepID=A0A557S4D0_9GAMM|nr:diguanylate cyclase [Sedimenticola selenatireducens]TVO72255.1 diguanylate cyclase [Sedimenticola selenatireducens]TVT61306.1 MAG: diguanylate cyclase [Sedimenticola selenatireducens]
MSVRGTSRRIIVYGFLLVIVVLLAITGTGLYRIQKLSSGLTEIVQNRNTQINLMHTMRQVARERSITLQSAVITKDPFTVDEYAMEMSAAASRYVTAREELLSKATTATERQLLERQHAQTVKTASSQNAIIQQLRDQEYQTAGELLFHTTLPGQRNAMAMMDEFILLKQQQNIESLKSTNQEIQQTYSFMIFLSAFGVLFSIAIATLIHRRISNEIMRREESESELRHSELRERTVRENMMDGLLTLNSHGRIVSCNKAGNMLFGYEDNTLIGKSIQLLMPNVITEDSNDHLVLDIDAWKKGHLGMSREEVCIHSNGSTFPAEIDISKIELEGEPVYIVVIRDITDKKAAQQKLQQFNQELEKRVEERTDELARTNVKLLHEIHERVKAQQELTHLATHDMLTGLPNRALFNEHLEIAINHAQRHGRQLALLFLDLDGFKLINDTFGHETGDHLLKTISACMQECVRKEDILARVGGDEFTLLLREMTLPADASLIASKLIKAINKPIQINNHLCHVGASIGISLFPQSAENAHELLRLADNAMYNAKTSGKNAFKIIGNTNSKTIVD